MNMASVRDQLDIWEALTRNITAADVLAMYRNPYRFQLEFSAYLNQLGGVGAERSPLEVCELGCEFGVTSLLLSPTRYRKHCLDLNAHVLAVLKEAGIALGQDLLLHRQDMFHTAFPDGFFDLVFNNGVLEHYSVAERTEALKECARIVRPGGKVIIGVPNHFSFPYRFAYSLRRLLHRWPYPPEEKIADFSTELREVDSLSLKRILFFDKEAIYALLPKARYSSIPFRLLDRLLHFQSYLRVIEFDRKGAP